MCGLLGAASEGDIVSTLLDGLTRLEYRGYDSAGVAFFDDDRTLQVRRRAGRVSELRQGFNGDPCDHGPIAIGHTRWATHGKPEERNTHPQLSSGSVAVVHNGIIENYENLKLSLQVMGYTFVSDTDTEVIPHLIHHYLQQTQNLVDAVRLANTHLSGSYAIAVMCASNPESIVVTRRDNPLVIGIGEQANFVASDVSALQSVSEGMMFPDDGDVVELQPHQHRAIDVKGHRVYHPMQKLHCSVTVPAADDGRAHMLREIDEQPGALEATLKAQTAGALEVAVPAGEAAWLTRTRHVQVAACGSSFYAAQVARYWIESLAGIPCSVEIASEYRNRDVAVAPDSLFVAVSQSGETADTLAALRRAKERDYLATLAICNVAESSMVREADTALLTHAGIEQGVAATKTFTTQLLSLLLLGLRLSCRGAAQGPAWRDAIHLVSDVRSQVQLALDCASAQIEALAARLSTCDHALFLGRGPLYPIAMEGALKLKELSYIHAEAYAAGELKHGPLALVDERMPIIALAPQNGWIDKIKSNLREVAARGGAVFVFADRGTHIRSADGMTVIEMPASHEWLTPIVYTVALQRLACSVALKRGNDVDHPRNLAKSVTVE